MKKNILLLLCMFVGFVSGMQAQIPAGAKKQPGKEPKIKTDQLPAIKGVAMANGITVYDIKIFEMPNYQGRSCYFTLVDGKFVPPFPASNISFTVPAGKIVYVRTFFEFSAEFVFANSQTNSNLENVTGIRSDEKTGIYVEFQGVSTSVHNNDCKRVFGDVKVKIIEISPDRDAVQSFMSLAPHPDIRGRQAIRISDTFEPFSFANATSIPEPYSRNHIYNNDPEPSIIYPRGRNGGVTAPATGYFVAGRKALEEGRVKILVMSDLGSAHKSCDLCDDFSSNVRMKTPVNKLVMINSFYPGTTIVDSTGKQLMFGPFEASGSRDGTAITASAGTIKEFRVYFKLKFYN